MAFTLAESAEPDARACRVCGCTEALACPGGCHWVEPDFCSACASDLDVRDPAQNPQPGDVLALDGHVREVMDRFPHRVQYVSRPRAGVHEEPLMLWQLWARKAEIRKVAA